MNNILAIDSCLVNEPCFILDKEELEIREWPQFPDKNLGIISEIVNAATKKSEVDPAAIALTSLVFAGAAFGQESYLKVGDTHHFPRLFTVLVGASSRGRKGSSGDPVKRIFRFVSDAPSVSPGPLSSGEGLIYAVRDESEKVDKDGIPLDAGVKDKRLIVHDGEFASVLKAAKRESNTLSAILRTAWDSGNIEPLTKTTKIKTTGAHISFVSHITREELLLCLSEVDGFNGFSNRILWCCVRRQNQTPFPEGISERESQRIGHLLNEAVSFARIGGEVTWDEDAKKIYEESYPSLTKDEHGLLGGAVSRAEAQTIRLSLIFSLLDKRRIIQPVDITRALTVWNYCLNSARYLFSSMESNASENKIIQFLNDGEKSTSQITKDLFKGHVEKLRETLDRLQSSGRIVSRTEKTSGRTTTYWRLCKESK